MPQNEGTTYCPPAVVLSRAQFKWSRWGASLKMGPNFFVSRTLFTPPSLSGMPLNTAQYLTKYGWKGHGSPLDGEGGRGLKKPLLIPKKRSLSGIGQDRDRAVEWWDDVFAVRIRASDKTRLVPKRSL